jgi:hypothetical protein
VCLTLPQLRQTTPRLASAPPVANSLARLA